MTITQPTDAGPTASSAEPLLLDEVQDRYDVTVAAHAIVEAPVAVTYRAARELDLLELRTPLLAASFWVRGLPERLGRRPAPPPPPRMRIVDEAMPGWMVLGERPDRELCFGAVGVFWTPTIEWKDDVAPASFATFDEPGWGRIACSFVTTPYGTHRTLLTYECRTRTTDERSRARFARYWWLVRPFVGHVLGATVRTIAAHTVTEKAEVRRPSA